MVRHALLSAAAHPEAMRHRLVIGALLALAASAGAARASSMLDALPPRVRQHLAELARGCEAQGGRRGDPAEAVEAVELDGDGAADVILDEARFPCRGPEAGALCPETGCSTAVHLSNHGRWRLAFDGVGSYCLDRSTTPARFLTVQRQYRIDGAPFILNVRYRFRHGLALQDGRGRC
jgi:hypothetical protein